MLPEHDVLVVDEGARAGRPGHLGDLRRADRRRWSRPLPAGPARPAAADPPGWTTAAGDAADAALDRMPTTAGSPTGCPDVLRLAVASVRDAARELRRRALAEAGRAHPGRRAAGGPGRGHRGVRGGGAAGRRRRPAGQPGRGLGRRGRAATGGPARRGCTSRRCPWPGCCGSGCSTERTVVLTSATLAVGGSFDAAAGARGPGRRGCARLARGLDVGSPFDYPRQAMLYVARHLPPPGRDGIGADDAGRAGRADRRRPAGARSGCSPPGGRRRPRRSAMRRAARRDRAVPGGRRRRRPWSGEFAARRGYLPVRDAVAVAGGGRARLGLPAGGDRPDPVPAPGRPAGLGPAAGRRPRPAATASWRWRPRTPRCCWPRASAGWSGTGSDRGRGCGAGPPAGHRPVRARSCARRCRRSGPTTDRDLVLAALRRIDGAGSRRRCRWWPARRPEPPTAAAAVDPDRDGVRPRPARPAPRRPGGGARRSGPAAAPATSSTTAAPTPIHSARLETAGSCGADRRRPWPGSGCTRSAPASASAPPP